MRGRAAASHVALHLPGARPPARSLAPGPRLLLLLFSPLQLGLKQPRRKPRGFFFFFFRGVVKTPEGSWQEGGGA